MNELNLSHRTHLLATAIVISLAFSLPLSALLFEETTTGSSAYMHPYLRHDVAITGVTPYKTVVSQGEDNHINVTVANEGDSIETFDVTAYANITIIGMKGVTLVNGSSTTITFIWNTTGYAKGSYTVSAHATPVPGETDTADNTYEDGTVLVTHAFLVSIYTDKYTYDLGDTMYLGVDFANLDGAADACLEILLEYPDGSSGTYMHQHDAAVPAFYSFSSATFDTFVLPLMPIGIYSWQMSVLDPATHAVIVEDDAEWEYTHPSQFWVEIYTDKDTYSRGDTMYLGIDFANLDGATNACLEILLEYPDGSTGTLLHEHDVTVPALYSVSSAAFKEFLMPDMPVGVHTWYFRVLDPVTHAVIVEDTAEWEFS